jgi:DNA repair protein RadD
VSITLRPYQIDAVSALRQSYARGSQAALLQLATATGKTINFADITRSGWLKGRRILVVVHTRELVKQASEKLSLAGVPHGIIAAGFAPSPNEPAQICSIQTAARRFARLSKFDLFIFDEAHHCRARSWQALIAAQPKAKVLGVTATPARLDGKGLGTQCGRIFDDLICGPSIAELIEGGFLSPVRYFVPERRIDFTGVRTQAGDWVASQLAERVDRGVITDDAVAKYQYLANHRPAIAFCATVAHAEHVAEAFRHAGYRAAAVDGKMPKPERDRRIAGLGNGNIEILTSCALISEGLDVLSVGAVILLRPTNSVVLHHQQIGRGMRPAPGKDHLMVADHVGNILRLGRPDIDRRWSLDGVEKTPGREAPMRICPECGCVNSLGATECENCDHEFIRRRLPLTVPGRLVEAPDRLNAILAMSYGEILRSRLSEHELRAYAESRGYKPGWVYFRLRDQKQAGLR